MERANSIRFLLLVGLALVFSDAQYQVPSSICIAVMLPLTHSTWSLFSARSYSAMAVALADLKKTSLLPNTTIELLQHDYWSDTHGYTRTAAEKAIELIKNMRCPISNTSVSMIYGSIDDNDNHGIAMISAALSIPQLSFWSSAPALSNKDVYAFFNRVSPSDDTEAAAIKTFIRSNGWKQFAVLYSDDVYGVGLVTSFRDSTLTVVEQPVRSDDTGSVSLKAMQLIKTLRIRIVVIAATSGVARLLMSAANKLDMTKNGDYFFIGTSVWTFGKLGDPVQFLQDEKDFMQGVIAVNQEPAQAALLQKMEVRLAELSPTLFPPIHKDPVDLALIQAWNGIMMAAAAYDSVIRAQKPITSINVQQALREVSVIGYAGRLIKLEASDGDGVRNFFFYNMDQAAWRNFGWWDHLLSTYTQTAPISWPGGVNDTSDIVPRHLQTASSYLRDICLGLVCILLVISLFLHYLLDSTSEHEVIKASSPPFLHIIVAGSVVAYAGLIGAQFHDDAGCALVPGTISIGFSLIFGSLFAKTYRIHKIFNASGLKSAAPSNNSLFKIVFGYVGLELLLLCIFFSVDRPLAMVMPNPQDEGGSVMSCEMKKGAVWWGLLVAPKGLLLGFGVYLAYKVRALSTNFNESRYIAMSLFFVSFISIVMLPMVSVFWYDPVVSLLLKTIGIGSAVFITIAILFVPKYWDIYITRDWVEYKSNSSYISGVLLHKHSRVTGVQAGTAAPQVTPKLAPTVDLSAKSSLSIGSSGSKALTLATPAVRTSSPEPVVAGRGLTRITTSPGIKPSTASPRLVATSSTSKDRNESASAKPGLQTVALRLVPSPTASQIPMSPALSTKLVALAVSSAAENNPGKTPTNSNLG